MVKFVINLVINQADINNAEIVDKSTTRLVESPLDKRSLKMTQILNKFSEKINNHFIGENEHDKDDFLKPIVRLNDNNEHIISEVSKISKVSVNLEIKKQHQSDLRCYTNEKRDSPGNSFYEEKQHEIQHMIDIGDEDSNKNNLSKGDDEFEEEDMEEELEDDDDYKVPAESEFKTQLNPPSNDRISDFDEKTKGRNIEIFKKNTAGIEKEENLIKDLSLNKNKNDDKNSVFVKLESKIKCKIYCLL